MRQPRTAIASTVVSERPEPTRASHCSEPVEPHSHAWPLPSRRLTLVLITRAAAATAAAALLAAHRVPDADGTLIVIVVGYTALTSLLAIRWPGTTRHPAAWCTT